MNEAILSGTSCSEVLEEFNCYANSRVDKDDTVVIENCNFDPVIAVPKDISASELKDKLLSCTPNLKEMVEDEAYILSKLKKINETGKIPAYKISNDTIVTCFVDGPTINYY